MNIPGLTIARRAEGAIASYSIVTRSATDDDLIAQAIDGSKLLLGVTTIIDSDDSRPTDHIKSGLADVRYGGVVTVDAPLTADPDGNAIVASSGDYIIGYAEVPGDEGEIGSVWIVPGVMA